MESSANPVEEAVIVMSRVFDAPREKVWKVLTNPKHVAQWYGGHGFTNPVCEMDVRPGGLWHHVMRAPDGSEYTLNFIYVEVDEPKRLVWKDAAYGVPGAGGPPSAISTVTLETEGGKTKWTLVVRFDSFADRDLAIQMGFEHMVNQGNERLAAYLKTL